MRPGSIVRKQIRPCAFSAVLSLGALAGQPSPVAAHDKTIGEQEANAIATDAYLYFYPLVIMDLTRRQMTNVSAANEPAFAPPNAFHNIPETPPATLKVAVRQYSDKL